MTHKHKFQTQIDIYPGRGQYKHGQSREITGAQVGPASGLSSNKIVSIDKNDK